MSRAIYNIHKEEYASSGDHAIDFEIPKGQMWEILNIQAANKDRFFQKVFFQFRIRDTASFVTFHQGRSRPTGYSSYQTGEVVFTGRYVVKHELRVFFVNCVANDRLVVNINYRVL